MSYKKIYNIIATLGPIGYLPAPGTMATLATLPLVWFLKYNGLSCAQEFVFLSLLTCISYYIIKQATTFFGDKDPSQIVLDELCGILWAFFCLPLTLPIVCLTVILFRFFDITKYCGIAHCEDYPGACGILLDDLVAALFTNIIMHVLLYAFL